MSEKIHQSYIYIARPDLIKEWHPTKNGKSNPRNVTCDHAEEVWWLCEIGHEWEATVKSRMVGDRCPLCVTELPKEPSQQTEEYLQQPHKTHGGRAVDPCHTLEVHQHEMPLCPLHALEVGLQLHQHLVRAGEEQIAL